MILHGSMEKWTRDMDRLDDKDHYTQKKEIKTLIKSLESELKSFFWSEILHNKGYKHDFTSPVRSRRFFWVKTSH